MTPQWLMNAMTGLCTIYDRVNTGFDEYGNEVYVSTAVADSPCLLQPVSESDIQAGRATVGTFTLYLPSDAAGVVDGFTQFDVGGALYEADGPPAVHSHLYASDVHHVEVAVVASTA